jgi:hypothetical protein
LWAAFSTLNQVAHTEPFDIIELIVMLKEEGWNKQKEQTSSMALVRERTIPNERPLLVGEVSANVCG